jgi:serine/threonine protein phosphatase PrpC
MAIITAMRVEGQEDRAAVFPRPNAFVVAVADGGGGVAAADAVLAAVRAAGVPADAAACVDVLAKLDQPLGAESTAVVAVLLGDRLIGASVGDSSAWLVTAQGFEDLTEGQNKKQVIGSGQAVPVPFTRFEPHGTLLVATDGLFKYVPHDRIAELARNVDLEAAADQLLVAPRLATGAWPDDVAIVLTRAG